MSAATTKTREPDMAARDDFDAIDWQGQPVDCTRCEHAAHLLPAHRCELRVACVHDRYAKRVERFFAWNPDEANHHLDHPYFEVRAIAARHADVFRLTKLLADPDGTVRFSALARLPTSHASALIHDPDREVRVRVALRLDESELLRMADDIDYYVRKIVAKRVPAALLQRFENDPDREVRRVVAERHSLPGLMRMARDPDDEVRAIVADRVPAALLDPFVRDPSWQVRYRVAERLPVEALGVFENDEDPMVRELVESRRSLPANVTPMRPRSAVASPREQRS